MRRTTEFYASTQTAADASARCKALQASLKIRATYRYDEDRGDYAIWLHPPAALNTESTLRRLFA